MAATWTLVTDGACSGNGTDESRGGWAAIITGPDGAETVLTGGEYPTTNNRMELMAAIQALDGLTRPAAVKLHTDSVYVRSGITNWLAAWKRNGWQTKDRKPVKNADLWQRLESAAVRHQVEWLWVKGHNGDPGNERADRLANRGLVEAVTAGAK